MMKKVKHDVIKSLFKRHKVDMLLMIKGEMGGGTKKPFTIVYQAGENANKFVTVFYKNEGLRQLYQLIDRKRITDYAKFVNDVMADKRLEVEVL